MTTNPIICAVDTTSVSQAKELAAQISGHIGALKLGLEFFTANGAAGVRELEKSGIPIFLDLKFHDIPNTVAGAIKGLSDLNIFMTTVHTSGGKAMMEAAREAIDDAFKFSKAPSVIGVTVLTSLNNQELAAVGINDTIQEQAIRLAMLAKSAGLDGVVCSGHEIVALKKACGNTFKLVVPGIRPKPLMQNALLVSSENKIPYVKNDDQKRVMTPKEALQAGADYLVIGRPITEAPDPKAAAQSIASSLDA